MVGDGALLQQSSFIISCTHCKREKNALELWCTIFKWKETKYDSKFQFYPIFSIPHFYYKIVKDEINQKLDLNYKK